MVVLYSLSSHATDLQPIYNVIKYVETNNRELAVGDNGKAYGVVQIHKVCVDDVNRIFKTQYTHQDSFDEACAREIFTLYLCAGYMMYQARHGVPPTEDQLVRMWNGGIYSGHVRKSTLRYLRKYYIWKEYLRQRKGKLA